MIADARLCAPLLQVFLDAGEDLSIVLVLPLELDRGDVSGDQLQCGRATGWRRP
jgi:hypothetical protein